MRELVSSSPSNDGHVQGAISYLLYSAPNDAEFQADLAAIVKVRKERGDWANLRSYLPGWVNEAKQNAMHKAHAQVAAAALAESDKDPVIKSWITIESGNIPLAQAARTKLLEPENVASLNLDQIRSLFYHLGYYHRHYGNQQQRVDSATVYGRMTQKFPTDFEAATLYLTTATDYAAKEVQKEATLHMMKLDPPANDPDAWYRMFRASEANADPELGGAHRRLRLLTPDAVDFITMDGVADIGPLVEAFGLPLTPIAEGLATYLPRR